MSFACPFSFSDIRLDFKFRSAKLVVSAAIVKESNKASSSLYFRADVGLFLSISYSRKYSKYFEIIERNSLDIPCQKIVRHVSFSYISIDM